MQVDTRVGRQAGYGTSTHQSCRRALLGFSAFNQQVLSEVLSEYIVFLCLRECQGLNFLRFLRIILLLMNRVNGQVCHVWKKGL